MTNSEAEVISAEWKCQLIVYSEKHQLIDQKQTSADRHQLRPSLLIAERGQLIGSAPQREVPFICEGNPGAGPDKLQIIIDKSGSGLGSFDCTIGITQESLGLILPAPEAVQGPSKGKEPFSVGNPSDAESSESSDGGCSKRIPSQARTSKKPQIAMDVRDFSNGRLTKRLNRKQRKKYKKLEEILSWGDIMEGMEEGSNSSRARNVKKKKVALHLKRFVPEISQGSVISSWSSFGDSDIANRNQVICSKKSRDKAVKIIELGEHLGLAIEGNREEAIGKIINMELRDRGGFMENQARDNQGEIDGCYQ
ncbi:hypothetical protein ACS0TY_018851 [Phlomoides rotata]